ncbi:MAG TPA: hypothetical protein VM053_01975 [Gemmatimonadaceae bacterium]|nr:hypothetical protein [Gemmatimonadaceae bacterium]
MNKTIKLLSVAAFCAIIAACASMGTKNLPSTENPTTLVVENRNVLDMNIYIIRGGGQRLRVGTANGLAKTKFTIPRGIVLGSTTVRFLADPIGGTRGPVSEEITMQEGDEVGLMLPPF